MADRHGAREIRLRLAHLQAARLRREARHSEPAQRHEALRLGARARRRQHHRPDAEQRLAQPRAGRPVRVVGRAARDHPRDLRGGEHPSRAGARGDERDRRRRDRSGLRADLVDGRDPPDAEGALRHHAALPAQGRRLRPRDDVPNLYGAGESRLFLRSRHGQEVPGRPGAAASRDRPVRKLALPRGPAESDSCPTAARSGRM